MVALAICFAWAPPEPAFGPVAVLARPGWGLYAWVNAAVVGIELVLGWLAVGLLIFSRRAAAMSEANNGDSRRLNTGRALPCALADQRGGR